MEVIRETLWKRCLSTPTKPPAKNSNICLSETAYQHKGTRKKCKKTNQAAIIQWQRQCVMDKPFHKPWPKSKTSDISKQSSSPLHHTFLLGRARFTAQPLSALIFVFPDGSGTNTIARLMRIHFFAKIVRFQSLNFISKPKGCLLQKTKLWEKLIVLNRKKKKATKTKEVNFLSLKSRVKFVKMTIFSSL